MDLVAENFQRLEDRFHALLLQNKADVIAPLLSADWVLLEPYFGIIPRDRFLLAIRTGALVHTAMQKPVQHVQVHGHCAIVVSRGQNRGLLRGQPFDAAVWVTNVYLLDHKGNWICTATTEAADTCGVQK